MRARTNWILPLAVFAVATLLGLSKFLHLWLDDLARSHRGTAPMRLIEEMTGAYGGALVFLVLVPLVRRYPVTGDSWTRRVPVYLAVAVGCGLAATSFMWVSRSLLTPLAGLGLYDYGLMRFRYPMELALQLPNLALMVLGLHAWGWYRRQRDTELRAAQLERELERSRIAHLESQLQPHFLFNTLNGISSLMYRDPALADGMLARLSDLLRLTFQQPAPAEVPLRQELEWLAWYLELMQLRFGDRLTIRRTADAGALDCLVPRLVLQPLVENALKHGVDRRAGPVTVAVTAERDGDRLRLVVEDDGPGLGHAQSLADGVGLRNTRDRLAVLYRDSASLRLRPRDGGGLRAEIEMPARRGAAARESA